MPDQRLVLLASEVRARAEEIWTRAETFHDADSQEKMRTIAATYEELVQRIEQVPSTRTSKCRLRGTDSDVVNGIDAQRSDQVARGPS